MGIAFNKVLLIGRFTRDPEFKTLQDNLGFVRGTLAVDRRAKSGEEKKADFISLKAFGKTAEFIQKYFTKGMLAIIEGHISTGRYDDKDGKTVYTTDVIIDNIQFGESKRSSGDGSVENGTLVQGDDFVPAGDNPFGVPEEEIPF